VKAALVDAYLAGESAASLGRRFHCSTTTVCAAVRAAGQEIRTHRPGPPTRPNSTASRPRKRKATAAAAPMADRKTVDAEAIRELYAQGLSIAKVAKKLGITQDIVLSRMREHGIEARSPAAAAGAARGVAERERLLREARAIRLEPPGPDDRCQWQSDYSKGALEAPRCGKPTTSASAKYCAEHAVFASSASVSKKPEAIAMQLAVPITCRCARCRESADNVPAGDAQAWFAQHREHCSQALLRAV
jgi:transposase-like protein